MRSLLDDLDHPAVDAFLDAVDEVMNSNTFLLKVRAGVRVTAGNRGEVLASFLRDPLFHDMMLVVDRNRLWWNLQPMAPGERYEGSLVVEDLRLTMRDLGRGSFGEQLRWMLREAFSPYGGHLDEERAEAVAGGLLEWLFGDDGDDGGWSFCAVRPDFLHNWGTGDPVPELAYFAGGSSDTATFFARGEVFYLLLTNGSP